MPLKDILEALVGVNQPKPGDTQAPGTVTSKDIYTPGVESLLSTVPALVGAYETAKGRPLGGALSILGQMGLTNAANRQQQHQSEGDTASRLEYDAARGVIPKDFWASGPGVTSPGQVFNQMSPESANATLDDLEKEWADRQKTQQTEQRQAPHIWTDKAGKVSIWDPDLRQMVRHPEMDSAKSPAFHSSTAVQDQLNAMGVTGQPSPAQYAKALSQSLGATAQRAGASTVAKVKALDTLPIGYSDPTANTYAVGPSGYTRVYAKDPAASWEGLRSGKLVIVQGADRQQFAYNQAAIKMLGAFNKMIAANKGYIPPNVDLQSMLGQAARRVVSAIDPESAADITTASTFLSDLINKSFTNRTISNQLKLVNDAINSPHGTKISDTKAVSTAIQLLQDNEQTLIQHGVTTAVGAKGALAGGATGGEAPEESAPATDSDPSPAADDSGWRDLK